MVYQASAFFRRLRPGETLLQVYIVFQQSPILFLSLALTTIAAYVGLVEGIYFYINPNNPKSVPKTLIGVALILLIGIPLCACMSVTATAVAVVATGQIYAGKEPDLLQCSNEAMSRYAPLFCTMPIFGCGISFCLTIGWLWYGILKDLFGKRIGPILVGLLVCTLSIYFTTSLLTIIPVIIIERSGLWTSLRRAVDVTRQCQCYVLGCFFLYITLIIPLVLISGVIGSSMGIVASLVLIGILIWLVSALTPIFITVIYFHIRFENENLNRELLLVQLNLNHLEDASNAELENEELFPLTSLS